MKNLAIVIIKQWSFYCNLKTCLIYNKDFVQYNGTGQTFLTDLRSKNTLIYPSFQKTKQKPKKVIFLLQIVWTFLFL